MPGLAPSSTEIELGRMAISVLSWPCEETGTPKFMDFLEDSKQDRDRTTMETHTFFFISPFLVPFLVNNSIWFYEGLSRYKPQYFCRRVLANILQLSFYFTSRPCTLRMTRVNEPRSSFFSPSLELVIWINPVSKMLMPFPLESFQHMNLQQLHLRVFPWPWFYECLCVCIYIVLGPCWCFWLLVFTRKFIFLLRLGLLSLSPPVNLYKSMWHL